MMGHGGRYHALQTEVQKARDVRRTLKRLVRYLKPYGKPLLLVAAMVVLNSILAVYSPRLIGNAVDVLWRFFRQDLAASLRLVPSAVQCFCFWPFTSVSGPPALFTLIPW